MILKFIYTNVSSGGMTVEFMSFLAVFKQSHNYIHRIAFRCSAMQSAAVVSRCARIWALVVGQNQCRDVARIAATMSRHVVG